MSDCSVVALWGDGHPNLGDVATRTVEPSTAIALSRGRFPKPYQHIDPNEDAALAATGRGGRLLAVADGHNGFDAARAAMETVAEHAPALLAADADPEAALHLVFEAAGMRVASAVADARGPRRDSRTALSVAFVVAEEAWTATLGDTAVVRVRSDRAKVVSDSRPFLGPASLAPPVESIKLRDGDRLLAVTDGVVEYLGSSWHDRLARVVAGMPTAREGVLEVMRLTLLGGAGDHVAIAGAWPAGDGPLDDR